MKRLAKTTLFLFLMVVSGMFTQCENIVGPDETVSSFRVVHYNALPAAIRSEVNTVENALKTTYAYKNDKPFGKLIANRIHQRSKPNGNTSYTLGLRQTGEGFYYDNLVINEDTEGNLKSRIIRYQPDPEWFYRHKTEGVGYDTYSGEITIFNSTGEALSSVTLVSGQLQQPVAKATALKADGTNCEIIDIQEAGLEQEGEFYIYEITITVDCSGTGGGGYEEEGMNTGFGNEGGEEGGGGGSPGGGGGNGGPGEPIETVPVEDAIIIDPDFINDYPCQAQIVQEVYGNCAPLSQLFQDIFESNDNVHVTFTAEELQGILDGGHTDGEIPHNYSIELNTLRFNQATELDLINVTTHEYVHAIMFHYFYSGNFQLTNAGNPPSYEELAEGFAKHRAGFGGDHHPYMASLVNDIAEVTYAWATANGYDSSDFAAYDNNPGDDIDGLKEFLRKLAWSGLKNTSTFETLYPDGSPEEQAIQKIIQDEIFPNEPGSTAQGNPQMPCSN